MKDRRHKIAVAFLVLFLAGCAAYWLARWQQELMIDFKTFYAAAATANEGKDLYDVNVLNQTAKAKGLEGYVFPYLYTPFLAYVTRPWQALEPGTALRSVIGLNLVLLFPVLLLIGFDSRARIASLLGGVKSEAAFVFAAIALFAVNFHETLLMGQINLLVLLLIVLSLHFARTGRETLGGVFLGIAALLKITPLLLLVWFVARGRFKVLASCLVTIPVGVAVTLAMGALPAWQSFFAFLPKMSYGGAIPGLFPAGFFPNFSLAGFLSRLLPNQEPTVRIATITLIAALLAVFAWIVRSRRDEKAAELMLLPFLILMVIASPLTYVHHVLYIAPGQVLALCFAWSALRGWRRAVAVGSLLLVSAVAGFRFPDLYWHWTLSPLEAKLFTSINLYALLALMLIGLALALTPQPPRTRSVDEAA
ncbi:MAG TPA: glycosyltransferase 87 family protein [Thermoanaerobaculia bacterium]